jgi:hypothetical protein
VPSGSASQISSALPTVAIAVADPAEKPRAIGENFEAEFEVTLGEDGVDRGRLELLGEGKDGGVNVAGVRQLLAQPRRCATAIAPLRHGSNCSA